MSLSLSSAKMASPKRYFINSLSDFTSGTVAVPKDILKRKCLNYIQHILSKQGTTFDDCDGGLYVGLIGISYMCYYVSQHPEFQEYKDDYLQKGQEYLNHAISYANHPRVKSDKSMQSAFLLGNSGTFAVAAAVMKAVYKESEYNMFLNSFASLADNCIPINFLRCGSDELFVGRAGYLCGTLFLQKTFGKNIVPEEKIEALCKSIVTAGLTYSRKVNSPCPLMYAYYDTEYLGAAHGLCAILQMLLSFPSYLEKNPSDEEVVKRSADFLLKLQTNNGNFPCAMDEVQYPRPESDELVHWCHGAPGVVYLMAKAFLRWKEEKYLKSCLLCGEIVWKKGLLRKGPGICHGVAGSGYVFLLLYRLTNDAKHLHRAIQFAMFLFEDEFKAARVPDKPLSLYEGLAGTVCFLADILQPEKAHFPFFDVF
ncbi:lanC-like protein 3 [Uloborus diversus]|uniref:lanC-like protein 3 n=1 Tax=Uloborus diversus TaxID=327109 RepID=UPI0024094FBE|nr:lanC-like protein 3 [Uloborus diversus]XP_054712656.1 lanC-like protein 3 [Uloborus diversus]XP_054712657.1 lanC-like protein 3 [Uloborus diversus]XP_054712658.1 lanC-like protein 3 [Uloborus diversus]